MTRCRLPRCQYTSHLKACGVDPQTVTIQANDGNEFVGSWLPNGPCAFTQRVNHPPHATHRTIPPAAHIYPSDGETFHSFIERERFIIELFHCRSDFLAQVTLYPLVFHYTRTNFYKNHQTLIPIIR